ncbi:MAG: LacI family DNA-binding transcriptional regulator [Lachnospiraceae bacterium]|nr:LacI family DNA-binding transcriptional regulator [Lachnospiraceae bacterium]
METLTIKDIAKICKVSTSTVSRAINDDPGINAKTKERILRVVKEFHFVPNSSARNLKLTESNTVGLLIKGVGNQFFQSMYTVFEKELHKRGYEFIMNELNDRQNGVDEAMQLAKEKRLKGIIFMGGFLQNPEVRLKDLNIPFVFCTVALNPEEKVTRCSTVAIDDSRESYKAVDYLCKKGHKRIAIITGRKEDTAVGYLRTQGYIKALKDNGIEVDPELIRSMPEDGPDYSIAAGYQATKQLIEDGIDFTALYVISDLAAFGAYRAISEAGKKIPEDYSVIGFDGLEMTRYMVPALTTIKQPEVHLAKSAVALLMKQIEGENEPVEHLVYDASLMEQESVRDMKL